MPSIIESVELNARANLTWTTELVQRPIFDDDAMFQSDFHIEVVVKHPRHIASHRLICIILGSVTILGWRDHTYSILKGSRMIFSNECCLIPGCSFGQYLPKLAIRWRD